MILEFSLLAKGALSQLGSRVTSHVLDWFRKTPIELAATRISSTHPHGKAFKQASSNWLNSPAFKTAVFGVPTTSQLDPAALASALIDAGFYADDDTPRLAQEIVVAFFAALEDELLKGEGGLSLAHRIQMSELRSLTASSQSLHVVIERISTQMTSAQPMLEDATGMASELNRRIDVARDQLQAGKMATARDLFRGIRKDIESRAVSSEIHHRLLTNLGVCELQLVNPREAAELFEAAYQIRPDDPKAKANRALAYRLRGDLGAAKQFAEEARRTSPANPSIISVLSDILERLGRRRDAIQLIDDAGAHTDGLRERLAELYLGEGLLDEALNLLAGIDRQDLAAVVLRAEIELRRAQQYAQNQNPLPGNLSDVIRTGLHTVEEDLGAIIDAGRIEWPAVYIAARTARGYARAFLGRHEEACEDLDVVAGEEDVDANVLVRLAAFRVIIGRPTEAFQAAEQALRLKPDDVEINLIVAEVAGAQGDWPRSLSAAYATRTIAKSASEVERAEAVAAEALRRLQRFDEAQSLLDKALAAAPGSFELLSVRANLLHDRGDAAAAAACAETAINSASKAAKVLATVLAGDLALRSKRYDDAVRLYREIANPRVINEPLVGLVFALYQTRRFNEAIAIACQARGSGRPLERVTEIEAAGLENIGQLQTAAALYSEMVEWQVAPVRALERLAIIYYRQGRLNDVAATVAELLPRAQGDARALMSAAQLLVALGRVAEALPAAYRALGLAQNQPDLHLAYMTIINATPDEQVGELSIDVAGIDTAVSIDVDDESATYVILRANEQQLWPDELALTSELTQRLLGHRAGDVVPLPPGPFGPRSARVTSVRHKYVARFQAVLADFNRRFPESVGMWKISPRTR